MDEDITPLPVTSDLTNDMLDALKESSKENHGSISSAAVTGFISAAGIICNIVVIFVILILRDYKKTTHWYVLNLALADTMFLIVLPCNVLQIESGKWDLGLPLCVLFQGMFYVNYYAGVLFLAVMSFDRYVAIAHPVSYSWRRIRSSRGSRLIAVAVWVVAIGASAPLMAHTSVEDDVCDFSFETLHPECEANGISINHCKFYLELEGSKLKFAATGSGEGGENLEDTLYSMIDDGYEATYEGYGFVSETKVPHDFTLPEEHPGVDCVHANSEDFVTWIIGNFILSFVVPLSVMGCCYGGLLWRIQHPRIRSSGLTFVSSKKSRNSSVSSDKGSRGMDKKVRITILVVSLIVVFVVCWTPFHAVVLAKIPGIGLSSDSCSMLKNAVLLIAYSNSLLNPIMYSFLGINFGKRLKLAASKITFRRTSDRSSFSRRGSASKSSRGGTKMTKTSSSSETAPPAIQMQLLGESRTGEASQQQSGSSSRNGHIVKITNRSIEVEPSERMLGGTSDN